MNHVCFLSPAETCPDKDLRNGVSGIFQFIANTRRLQQNTTTVYPINLGYYPDTPVGEFTALPDLGKGKRVPLNDGMHNCGDKFESWKRCDSL